jgi:Leucine-rich repeat (LRR) protein
MQISHISYLEKLKMNSNQIEAEEIKFLSKANFPNLKKLNISGNHLKSEVV